MKVPVRTSTGIAAVLCWLLFSALTVFIILGMRDRARLIRDNDNERLFNMLFTSLRRYDDFGSAIESNPMLKERIAGFGIYGDDLTPAYSWGAVPPVFNEETLRDAAVRGRNGRYTLPDRGGYRVKFILHTERAMPGPPSTPRRPAEAEGWGEPGPPGPPAPAEPPVFSGPPDPAEPPTFSGQPAPSEPPAPTERHNWVGRPDRNDRPEFRFLRTLISGKYLYIDIAHPAYGRTNTLTAILFPLCEAALLMLVFRIRSLYLRNREYRERIEAQKNLVVLGNAASTLAHEIKNPLLSIRLQTGILEKLFPGTGREELTIINEEVDRLSALIYRVNDYLREVEGERAAINGYDFLREVSLRLCGRNIVEGDSIRDGFIRMDVERARSVFENIIRNALESGGPAEAVGARVTRNGAGKGGRGGGSMVVVSVFDRGRGIAPADLNRIFEPFFTSKSTGTGIGLSISKRFVEAVGGRIEPENREGGGVVVRVFIPEYVPAGEAGEMGEAAEMAARDGAGGFG
ncbi:MAG: HAMP domain-containing histidine kinase [Spirochaetaceae bacterium]|jgi:two-component system sensor histidine kinase HydH|nr:HAMP domain-containing histidine kinase [Spirochaetaceae bacterium]